MALFDTIRAGASGASTGYEIERSLRFNDNDSTNLRRTPSSDGNRQKFTVSVWLKRANLGEQVILDAFRDDSNRTRLLFDALNRMRLFTRLNNNSHGLITENIQRDITAWYHLVWSIDTTQSTSSNRVRMYVNGVEQDYISGSSQPDQNESLFINKDELHAIGVGLDSGGDEAHFDGYLAEFNLIDGQQLTPDSFAETDSTTGQYNPIKYTGSYGTNGFYLNFSDNSSTSALGTDSSGNGHNFTPNNFSVAAWPNNDSVVDTPTNNFATLNVLDKHGNVSTSNGNLETASSTGGSHFPIFTAMSMRGGKYYLEYKCLNNDNGMIMSIMNIEHDGGSLATDSTPGNNASAVNKVGFGLLVGSGRTSHNGTLSSPGAYGSALAVNGAETGMCAVDLDNGKIWWGKEGTFFDSGDPANGTNAAFTTIDTDTTWNFCFHVLNNNNLALNWGQHGYSFTPPTGFGRLCTADLAEPEIKNPTKHHETILYSADNGSHTAKTISGLDFSPDLVWCKNRSRANRHALFDTLRGVTKRIRTDGTDAEVADSDTLTSFNSDGFSIGADTGEFGVNANDGSNFASWNWNGGSSTVTNTSGTISTQVRANQTCGFSIIEFTYHTSGTANIGHGLGKPPQWIIAKTLSNTTHWVVFHKSTGANAWFNLNTSPKNTGTAVWDNQMPTNTLINLGFGMVNQQDTIMYAWSEIVGFSAFGRYIGNGSSNGPYVHTGFQPAWLMYKNVSQNGGQWFIRDNKRETGNPNNRSLAAEANTGETHSSLVDTDFLSNGFKLRETNEGTNNNQIEYIFMAFAKHPVKYTRAV